MGALTVSLLERPDNGTRSLRADIRDIHASSSLECSQVQAGLHTGAENTDSSVCLILQCVCVSETPAQAEPGGGSARSVGWWGWTRNVRLGLRYIHISAVQFIHSAELPKVE
jgi:hypothetical protein